jgi:hypothetical protein
MNFRLRYILAPALVGALAFSCDKKDIEDINPSLSAEASALATSASMLFDQGFEGSNPLSSFHSIEVGASHSLTVADRPGGGGKSARFELRQNDPDVKGSRRAEVTVIKGDTQKEMWYAYDAYFPSKDYVDEKDDENITQWHQSGMGSPSASIRVTSGRIIMTVRNHPDQKEKVDLGPATKDKWLSLVVHMVHSSGSDGLTEVWMDGKQVLSRKGGNMYAGGELPKWKLGIYKSTWDSQKTTTDKRVLFFDNIRVGKAGATLADMTSSTVSTGSVVTEPAPTPVSEITAPVSETTAPSTGGATSITLVDAHTEKDVLNVTDGSTLSFSALGTKKLNFRANFDPATVANVKFELTGAASHRYTDGAAPFALFGDDGKGNYYYGQILPTGSYTLKATPYSASGAAGTPVQIRFSIVESGSNSIASSTTGAVSSITLVDAHTEKDVLNVTDGSTLSFSALGTKKLNFRANFDPATVANVKFELTGAASHSYTDRAAPFALFGDDGKGNYYYGQILPTGSYTLKATPYSASGVAGAPMQISFSIKS